MWLRRLQTVIFLRFAPCRCVALAWGESFAENNRKYLRFIATDYAIVFTNCVLSARFGAWGELLWRLPVRYTHYVP